MELYQGTERRPAYHNLCLCLADGLVFLETNIPGIFAAGDVRHGSIKRIAAAVAVIIFVCCI